MEGRENGAAVAAFAGGGTPNKTQQQIPQCNHIVVVQRDAAAACLQPLAAFAVEGRGRGRGEAGAKEAGLAREERLADAEDGDGGGGGGGRGTGTRQLDGEDGFVGEDGADFDGLGDGDGDRGNWFLGRRQKEGRRRACGRRHGVASQAGAVGAVGAGWASGSHVGGGGGGRVKSHFGLDIQKREKEERSKGRPAALISIRDLGRSGGSRLLKVCRLGRSVVVVVQGKEEYI